MAMWTTCIAILFAILAYETSSALPPINFYKNGTYDHFWFVQMWPFGYCSGPNSRCNESIWPSRNVNSSHFYIHGLWPVNSSGNTISSYPGPPYPNDSNYIPAALYRKMNLYWPSLENTGNRRFWAHEWRTHGSVAYQRPLRYYNKTITIRMKLIEDLSDSLYKHNVTPGKSYLVDDYVQALQNGTGNPNLTFIFRCVGKKDNITFNPPLLKEVVLCVDKNAKKFIPCENATKITARSCGPVGNQSIMFPNKTF